MSLLRRAPRQVRNDPVLPLSYPDVCDGRISLADAGGGITSVRPGRVRNRTKTAPEEKLKKPADETRKKSPPARKGPGRGRYVDEYARPAL